MEREPNRSEFNPSQVIEQVEDIVKSRLVGLSESESKQTIALVDEWLVFVTTSSDIEEEFNDGALLISNYLSLAYRDAIRASIINDNFTRFKELEFDYREGLMLSTVLGRMGGVPITIQRAARLRGGAESEDILDWTSKFFSGLSKLYMRTKINQADNEAS